MAEEPETIQTPEAGPGQRANRGQQRRQRSVLQYIVILFAAAFVLLLITFMMERRQYEQQQQESQASIDDLQQQSVSAVQTLKGMTEENTQLREQVEDLQQQIEALEKQLASAKEAQSAVQEQLHAAEKQTEALAWFWELNDAYLRGRLNVCKSIISSMEEAGMVEFLPEENTTGQDYLSPAERYQEIYDIIIK